MSDSSFKAVNMDKTWTKLTCKVKTTEDELKVALIQTELAGRGLVATQDLSKNETIFTESPFVVGPAQTVGAHFCASCSQPLNVGVLQGKVHDDIFDDNFCTINCASWHVALTERDREKGQGKGGGKFLVHFSLSFIAFFKSLTA